MALVNNESILMSIKKMLNIEPEEMAFDTEIGTFINAEFMTLNQLGIGPEGFAVYDADVRWADFSDDKTLIQTVKELVYMRVRMIFDPPASSIVADAINSRIAELEFRLNAQAERNYIEEHPDEFPSHEDPYADGEDTSSDRSIYKLTGENLTIFNAPKWVE